MSFWQEPVPERTWWQKCWGWVTTMAQVLKLVTEKLARRKPQQPGL